METPDEFWRAVAKKDNDCWEWMMARNQRGYGRLQYGKDQWLASRLAWVLTNGPIKPTDFVCHKCDNPPCVNPAHLFLGDYKANALDMVSKDRHQRGERAATHKISHEDALAVYQCYAKGITTTSELARLLSVREGTIRNILRGKTWPNVSGGRSLPVLEQSQAKALTPTAVTYIREVFAADGIAADLAAMFGVSLGTIYHIVSGHSWAELPLIPRSPASLQRRTRQNPPRSLQTSPHRQTHCKRGHPFTESNTLTLAPGRRTCRTCAYDQQMMRRRLLRGACQVADEVRLECPLRLFQSVNGGIGCDYCEQERCAWWVKWEPGLTAPGACAVKHLALREE